jgi:hypothetical protein
MTPIVAGSFTTLQKYKMSHLLNLNSLNAFCILLLGKLQILKYEVERGLKFILKLYFNTLNIEPHKWNKKCVWLTCPHVPLISLKMTFETIKW